MTMTRTGTWAEASKGLAIRAKDGGIWTLVSCDPGPPISVVMQDTRDIDRRVTVHPVGWDAPIEIVLDNSWVHGEPDLGAPNERTPGIELAAAELQKRKDKLLADIAAGEERARAAVAAVAAGQPVPVSALPKMTSANSGEAVPYVEPATAPGPTTPPAGPCPASTDHEHVLGSRPDLSPYGVGPCALCGAVGQPILSAPESVNPSLNAGEISATAGGAGGMVLVAPMAPPMPVAPAAEEPAATAGNPPSSPSSADPADASPLQAMGEVWPVQPLEDATAGEMHTHLILFHGEWTQDVPKKGKALLTELYRLHEEATSQPTNIGIGHIHRAKA